MFNFVALRICIIDSGYILQLIELNCKEPTRLLFNCLLSFFGKRELIPLIAYLSFLLFVYVRTFLGSHYTSINIISIFQRCCFVPIRVFIYCIYSACLHKLTMIKFTFILTDLPRSALLRHRIFIL